MKRLISLLVGMHLLLFHAGAEEDTIRWDLKACIEYALSHNIQVKKTKVTWQESLEETKEAKAQLFPSFAFSTDHSLVNRPESGGTDKNSYAGNYGLQASLSIYNGGKQKLAIKQQKLQNEIDALHIGEKENDIRLAVIESYLQVLYAREAVVICQGTVEVSEAQCRRGRQLMEAGSLSLSEVAQLEAQYSSDKYQLVAAQSVLEERKLELKQLLELGMDASPDLFIPELSDEEVLKSVPSWIKVYETSLEVMPQVKSGLLNIESSRFDEKIAYAGYYPALSLAAGVGTSHISGSGYSYSSQLKNNFNESVGLSLSIPLYSRRQNKTAVKLAQLRTEVTELEYEDVKKDLQKTIESVYLDAVSYQNQYRAAQESVKSAELSFELMQEQFNLGMKNTVELLTEKNNLLSARQQAVQAKYMAVLNLQLLNFYQGREINL